MGEMNRDDNTPDSNIMLSNIEAYKANFLGDRVHNKNSLDTKLANIAI